MNDWLDEFAATLGVAALAGEETGAVLKLARSVAHGVERKFAPLSTYLLGVAVGSRVGPGPGRVDAFREAVARTHGAVPPSPEDAGTSPGPADD
jgi:hypothetical protein